MAVKPVPDGFTTVTPYISVDGADRLIDFLSKAFDAQELFRLDSPAGTVGHAQVKIGNAIVMISEKCAEWPSLPGAMYLYVPDTDATYKRAIEAGATSVTEPADQFYGDRGAGVRDAFGNIWWIGTHIEEVSLDEIKERAKQKFC